MAKQKLQPLSRAETEMLRILWELGEATIGQVCDKLPQGRQISYSTVQTLIRRLETKGYVQHRHAGKVYIFYPVAKQEEVLSDSVREFCERLFGGDAGTLALYLAKHGKLTKADIERLQKIVDQNKTKEQ